MNDKNIIIKSDSRVISGANKIKPKFVRIINKTYLLGKSLDL